MGNACGCVSADERASNSTQANKRQNERKAPAHQPNPALRHDKQRDTQKQRDAPAITSEDNRPPHLSVISDDADRGQTWPPGSQPGAQADQQKEASGNFLSFLSANAPWDHPKDWTSENCKDVEKRQPRRSFSSFWKAAGLNVTEEENNGIDVTFGSVLGKGGSGVCMVYECQLKRHGEDSDGKRYAAKVLRNTGACYKHHIVKFRTELSILQEIVHPNIIRYVCSIPHKDPTVTGEGAYEAVIVMELCKGSLADEVKRRSKSGSHFKPAEVHKVAIQVCRALETLHNCRIVHRDINPKNIFLASGTLEPEYVLADFGESLRLHNPDGSVRKGLSYVTEDDDDGFSVSRMDSMDTGSVYNRLDSLDNNNNSYPRRTPRHTPRNSNIVSPARSWAGSARSQMNVAEEADPEPDNVFKAQRSSLSECSVGSALSPIPHGDARYAAPEVWLMQKSLIATEADVWSFGMLLYSLMELKSPYENSDVPIIQLREWLIEGRVPKLSAANRKKYGPLVELMESCWQISPNNRPSAVQLRVKLEAIKSKL
uniref:Protein kinase domain-containing protein n=1 Tax=Pyramimonas obovata TaxID=1411642 RepID=A0A7S0QNU5_9CHLO|mmetsp:Transcript_12934/g.27301  ORF Transcript_12934/g.27301 Transcript_12934/m.27301 type:complete len:542 (+) Transcript_12934:176-1801(+)